MSESDSRNPYGELKDLPREELLSFLFVQMILQTAEMALMFLGQRPHPQTGQPVHDLNGARMFIDQLEALEAKTKGNLNPEEAAMLKQSLMQTRMAFVHAVENPPQRESKPQPEPSPSAPETSDESTDAAKTEDEPRKRFSKKF